MMLLLLAVLLFLSSQANEIYFIKDGEEVDIEKQKAEGNIIVDGDILKINTDLSDIETEIQEKTVYGGAEIIQEYDLGSDRDENITITVKDGEQLISIEGNETDTEIQIDFNREEELKESVDVIFDVDHDGETYEIEYDEEEGVNKERYRVDEQELNVFVEENIEDGYEVINDEIEIEVLVDIDDIDLDWEDWLDFDIGLYGEKDNETNDDIFISGKYTNRAEERTVQEEIQEDPIDNILEPTDCSETPTFNIPEYQAANRGREFTQYCSIPMEHRQYALSYTWSKMNGDTGEWSVVSTSEDLLLTAPTCRDAAMYKCTVEYVCEGEVLTAESHPMSLIIDNGIVLNPICHIFGDPHIITFDKKLYSFQGECTYLLAMDAEFGRWLIYGLFSTCGEGSCLESVVIFNDGYAIELQRGWIINNNGEKLEIVEGKTISPDRTLDVYFDGYEVYMELRRPGIHLTWDGLMNLKIEVAGDEITTGLCGNNNGNPEDDFMTYYGDILIDANEFGHGKAVDRTGSCTKPLTSENLGDTTAARQVCEQVLHSGLFLFTSEYLQSAALNRGENNAIVHADQFMDACIFDHIAEMHVESLEPQCYAGYNYFSISRRMGICMPEGWQDSVGCITKRELQDLTVSQGCPYGDIPFPFNRSE